MNSKKTNIGYMLFFLLFIYVLIFAAAQYKQKAVRRAIKCGLLNGGELSLKINKECNSTNWDECFERNINYANKKVLTDYQNSCR